MVGAEGIEPSTSSASRKHSATELRAFALKPIYTNGLAIQSQYNVTRKICVLWRASLSLPEQLREPKPPSIIFLLRRLLLRAGNLGSDG